MADYKELLRRAITVLPENNGGARRAVYEKARTALVAQLRAIDPPLAAREITQHRLQLEDCIRQVEQEASEAVITGLKQSDAAPAPEQAPVAKPAPRAAAEAPSEPVKAKSAEPVTRPKARSAAKRDEQQSDSIADIIAAAEAATAGDPEPDSEPETEAPEPEPVVAKAPVEPPAKPKSEPKSEPRPVPTIVARAEAARHGGASAPVARPTDSGRRGPVIETRREGGQQAAAARLEPVRTPNHRPEPSLRSHSSAAPQLVEQQYADQYEVEETELAEPEVTEGADPQGAIDRAIAVLDREARGEPAAKGRPEKADKPGKAEKGGAAKVVSLANAKDDHAFDMPSFADRQARESKVQPEATFPRQRQRAEKRPTNPLTIFFGVFGVLLLGALGAGFWAWNEGYINLGMLGGQQVAESTPAPERTLDSQPAEAVAAAPPMDAAPPAASAESAVAAIAANEDRLAPNPQQTEPLALQPAANGEAKSEERLSVADAPAAAPAAAVAATPDAASLAGSQSLLLEASDGGNTGAVPFTGEVEWSKGVDEMGQPTLVAKAQIPARNLSVDVLIRRNADASLPASHLMEINFSVSDTFIGGAIASLPGVLLKNEELVQGVPLVGASARVVGNSFLFALSASANDATVNSQLLTSRKWMDLALVYATGKRAIITLEKDEAAQALFTEVFDSWSKTAAAQ